MEVFTGIIADFRLVLFLALGYGIFAGVCVIIIMLLLANDDEGWIQCKEEMPPVDTTVEVVSKYNPEIVQVMVWNGPDEGWWDDEGFGLDTEAIQYWRPLHSGK